MVSGRLPNLSFHHFTSQLAHRDGITMYCIGVGDTDEGELAAIASRPVASHVLHVLNYQAIGYLRNIMATRTCKGGYKAGPRTQYASATQLQHVSEYSRSSC